MTDEELLRFAIALAERGMAAGAGGPFGAVVARDGVVVGAGRNEVVARQDPTAHAEMVAIRDACANLGMFDLSGCSLLATCEPCPMCLGAVLWSRVDRLVYAASRDDAAAIGFADAEFDAEIRRSWDERSLPAQRLLTDDAVAMMRRWADMPGRVLY